LSDGQTDDGIG